MEVRIPAIGGFKDVGVIEVFVKPGDRVRVDDSLVTLESDKATMDVPAPAAGTVREVKVHVGDRVGEGSLVVLLDPAEAEAAPAPAPAPAAPATTPPAPAAAPPVAPPPAATVAATPPAAPSTPVPPPPAPVAAVAPVSAPPPGRPAAHASRPCAAWPGSSAWTSRASPARARTAASSRWTCNGT